MASGHLTHPSWDSDSKRGTTDGTMRNKYDQARAQDMPIIERVHGLAERLGVPMARIALAWHWAKDVTAPIVGCSKTERVDDVIEALGVKLSESDIAYLEEPYTAHELVAGKWLAHRDADLGHELGGIRCQPFIDQRDLT